MQTRVNEVTTEMIFQEKAAKEMLEFNKRREAPILEADERFFFKTVSKIEDNHLSGWSAGVVPLMNNLYKTILFSLIVFFISSAILFIYFSYDSLRLTFRLF